MVASLKSCLATLILAWCLVIESSCFTPSGRSSSVSFVGGGALRRGGGGLFSTKSCEVVTVPLDDGRSYPIYIGSGILSTMPERLAAHAKGRNVLVVTNDRIEGFYLERVKVRERERERERER